MKRMSVNLRGNKIMDLCIYEYNCFYFKEVYEKV